MGVAALCIRLLISVIILRRAHGHEGNAVLQIVPKKLQFFEYEEVRFLCKGIDGSPEWKVAHNSKGKLLKCSNTRIPPTLECTIRNIYTDDSGEYWCEAGAKKRSNSIVITVTAGSVILESPAFPVTEGDEVTLGCRSKTNSTSIFTTYFYKDGVRMNTSIKETLTIHSVSKSDEGLYKCSVSGAGESAENWLNVTGSGPITHPPSDNSAPWIVITVLLAVLLVVLGIHHFVKHYWHKVLLYLSTPAPGSDSTEETTDDDRLSAHTYYYALDLKDDDQDAPAVSAAVTDQPAEDFYSLLQ